MLEHENGKCWGKGKNQWEVKKTSGSEEFGERGGGGVPLKIKSAAEIRPEDDELSAVWNQRVLFPNWILKIKSKTPAG